MKITSKGQITIPNEFRLKYGLLPYMEVEFKEIKGVLCIVKAHHSKHFSRGKQIIHRMRSVKTKNMTTEEVMAITRGWGKKDDR